MCVALQQTCQWDKLAPLLQRLGNSTYQALQNQTQPAEQPMFNIWRSCDLGLNSAVARAWSQQAEQQALRGSRRYSHRRLERTNRRITLAYLSYDFRNHPVAHQLQPLFELHDRDRFRVLAYSIGADDGSIFHRQIENDSDEFIEIGHLSPAQSARRIHDDGSDILIDLMGHSHHNRMQIPALRPAPIQVGYLGFLATTGSDFIDYLIADEVVVPPNHYEMYSEKLLQMPVCYQMNHRQFFPTNCTTERQEWGLPSEGVVFCSFNSAYKISAELFAAWVDILKRVPGSVLWLLRDNALAEQQLKQAAERLGLETGRLIFTGKIPLVDHVQRLQLADLALDTIAYNGGATTANALWAGVPVLTILGKHWVSRMSASHLTALKMPELVASSLDGYIRRAVNLGRSSRALQALRSKLNRRRLASPLFDGSHFVRDLEVGYEMIWKRYCSGMPPAHIQVPKRSAGAPKECRYNDTYKTIKI
jgi:protein O-GlcNAc transferase